MSVPRATMRLQFHRDFTFREATRLVPYFASLGVSHLYASPILVARPGSVHGYDVIDPTRVNPELGGEDALRQLVHALRGHEMGLIVDIVPNHMAIGSDNPWWMDLLTYGQKSRYAKFFDVEWEPEDPRIRGKVILPTLGRPYGEALASGELRLEREGRKAFVRYFDHVFPIDPGTIDNLDAMSPPNFDPTSPAGREHLHTLLEAQKYRLTWWRSANDEINWRRFFDINELAAIRVEDDDVFEAVHAIILRLYREGLIDGVRVDHVDGLSLPGEYCKKLRRRLRALQNERPESVPREMAYLVVEKILAGDESLPAAWETDGTTGYDFMDEVNALQQDPAGEPALNSLWHQASGRPVDFAQEELLARRQILQRSFSAQREAVVQALYAIGQSTLQTRDLSRSAIRRCLTEILVNFSVYRIYARVAEASPTDMHFLSQAVAAAKQTCLLSDRWLVNVLAEWLSGTRIRAEIDPLQAVALTRFQQLSAPLCAKAVEDTAFYRYGRHISRNDVGFDARRFAATPDEFHQRMQTRATALPHSMLATATHDHKRGEDVRARLAVLSELPDAWVSAVEKWLKMSNQECPALNSTRMPTGGDLTMLFQTIIGAWPLGLTTADEDGLAAYAKRLQAWQQKALREAKLCSDWSAPNEVYETAASAYIDWLFGGPATLLSEMAEFARRIAPAGAANGLAQLLIKLTAPGVPDIYQGTEYWDLSLVDPDNRAAVDFAARQRTFDQESPVQLVSDWRGGRIKQQVITCVLAVRKKMPRLFSEGAYLPLEVKGPQAKSILAYARFLNGGVAITAVRRTAAHLLSNDGSLTVPGRHWDSTYIVLPEQFAEMSFCNSLHRSKKRISEHLIYAASIVSDLPVALLVNGKA
jgi:(1->4)-alpha-D-glucan 1-alpha-D-glucosylmutase